MIHCIMLHLVHVRCSVMMIDEESAGPQKEIKLPLLLKTI